MIAARNKELASFYNTILAGYHTQRQERRRSHWISRCTVSLAEFPATDFRFR